MMVSSSSQNASFDEISNSLVVGAGMTGMSCLRYLSLQGKPLNLYDDNFNSEKLGKVRALSETVKVYDEKSDLDEVLKDIDSLLLSPGFPLEHPLVRTAKTRKIELLSDIELFARKNKKPVLAVTGSNGKSTVVTLLSLMAKAQGMNVVLAGNIGQPVLDFIDREEVELFVLELSSFQLDITSNLKTRVSSILNISADHLDRYESFEAYAHSKQQIYSLAERIVFSREDELTAPVEKTDSRTTSFGLDEPTAGSYGLIIDGSKQYLGFGNKKVLAVEELFLGRKVDVLNALAAMAIAFEAGIEERFIVEVLKGFNGLPHRCELVKNEKGVSWFNDSKATNVGASKSAIDSFEGKSIILIAGGDAKGADLGGLETQIKNKVKKLLLIGKDADQFQNLFGEVCETRKFRSLAEAVEEAKRSATDGDVVLLSPACSSLDMFSSYQERGDEFRKLVSGGEQ